MKKKVLLGSLVWLLSITLLHMQLNVGWDRLLRFLQGRSEMVVGFLPVT